MFQRLLSTQQTKRKDHLGFLRALPTMIVFLLTIWTLGCSSSGETIDRPSNLPEEMVPVRTDISITNLTSLNSPRDDFGLTMSLDTSLVFYTSGRIEARGLHSIFWSRSTARGWLAPQLAVEVNNAESNGIPSITPGGQIMFFTGCTYGFGDCDLYRVASGLRGSVAEETTAWTIPRNLGLRLNGPYWDSQPSIAADGSMVVFSSDRPGGFGGRDIWISLREQDGSWGHPINAGRSVNTVFDEVTPWITPDCRTLYFASNGHPGLGEFDLYFVVLDPESGFSPVTSARNLGKPINSHNNDIAFSLSSDGFRAFFSSNRSGGLGGYDIYQLSEAPIAIDPLNIVHGVVTDSKGNPLFAEIEVTDLRTGNIIGRFQTEPETGEYALVLRRGGNYAITGEAPDYLFNSQQVSTPIDLPTNRYDTLHHVLQPRKGWVRLLLFFNTGSNRLERESTVDLDRLTLFLKANPDIRVEIGGHTENTDSPQANRQLSLERAEAVKSYLVGNRIVAERIDVKGYGDTRPIVDNDTEEGQSMNRRVEMRVVE